MSYKNNLFRTLSSSLILAGFLSSNSFAATQGAIGLTSTGSIDITATIQSLILITNLDDIDLGDFVASQQQLNGGLSGSDNFCVATNNTSSYTLTARGSGANNQFRLQGTGTNPASNILNYSVQFTDGTNQNAINLEPGVTVSADGAALGFTSCTTGNFDNQRVDVAVSNSELLNARSGSYSGTLTLTVSPI